MKKFVLFFQSWARNHLNIMKQEQGKGHTLHSFMLYYTLMCKTFGTLWMRVSKCNQKLMDSTKMNTLSDFFQKTIPSVALMGRPSPWRTSSRSRPSARCSPALLVPSALETLWENGWPVRSAASATAAPSRNFPITNRRRLVRLLLVFRAQVELIQHKSESASAV